MMHVPKLRREQRTEVPEHAAAASRTPQRLHGDSPCELGAQRLRVTKNGSVAAFDKEEEK